MNRKWLVFLIGPAVLLVVGGMFAGLEILQARSAPEPKVLVGENGELMQREISPSLESPAISGIDSPDPTCYHPVENTGACYITWYYMSVTAGVDKNIITMTVTIDNQLRAYHRGFFQDSMYIPGTMTSPGFKVTCGVPGSSGIPTLGKTHTYVIRARETGGLTSSNSGTVTCPADVVEVYLPILRR